MDAPFPDGFLDSIHHFLDTDSKREPGRDLYQEVFDTPMMFPLQRQKELEAMIRVARSIQPRTVMEIGSDKAGGLYHWCKCLPSVKNVIACEIRGTPYAEAFEMAFPNINFLWVPGSSYQQGNVNRVLSFLQEVKSKIDVLFIDGDKSHFDTDFYAYLGMMNPNGIALMHDITDEAPGAAYKRVCQTGFRHAEIIDKSDTVAALKREDAGEPAKSPHEGWLRHWRGQSCGVGIIYMPEA